MVLQSITDSDCVPFIPYLPTATSSSQDRQRTSHLPKSFCLLLPPPFPAQMVAISSLGDTCSPSGMPVIRCSQAASPLLLIGKDMWVFLLLLWLEELTGRPLGWWTQALTACGKLFPKSMHASFGRGDRPSLSLAQSQRESGYEVFPRNNPQDA